MASHGTNKEPVETHSNPIDRTTAGSTRGQRRKGQQLSQSQVRPTQGHKQQSPTRVSMPRKEKDYKLNMNKALEKKQSVPVKCEIKDGRNWVLTCSAAYYELLKNSFGSFLANQTDVKVRTSRGSCDKTGATESSSVRLSFKNNKEHCVVNFYHTTSTLLVNGKHPDSFITGYMHSLNTSINEELASIGCSLSELNEYMKFCISSLHTPATAIEGPTRKAQITYPSTVSQGNSC